MQGGRSYHQKDSRRRINLAQCFMYSVYIQKGVLVRKILALCKLRSLEKILVLRTNHPNMAAGGLSE